VVVALSSSREGRGDLARSSSAMADADVTTVARKTRSKRPAALVALVSLRHKPTDAHGTYIARLGRVLGRIDVR
jgi:hypothetical protein